MARITVEDCLKRENNRFALVQLASKRTKMLLSGAKVLIDDNRSNKAVVTALREVASGVVRFMTAEERSEYEAKLAEEQAKLAPPQLPLIASDATGGGSGGNSSGGDGSESLANGNGSTP